MANLYSKELKKVNGHPSRETINFILNYSKALKITGYKKLQFETMLN